MTTVDPTELRRRLERVLHGRFPDVRIVDLVPLEGGISSLTFAASLSPGPWSHERVVVKVAPPGLKPVRNRDVLRQARIFEALSGLDGLAVPAVLGQDDAPPPLFVMEFVAGESFEPLVDSPDEAPPASEVAARALAAADMLARLHEIDPGTLRLGDEPVVSPAAELERWARLFRTCPPELRGAEADLLELLLQRVPEAVAPRVSHGDYRLANMQFVGAELRALIDWEIWAVGDPRFDLAWLLMHTDPAHRFTPEPRDREQRDASGMPDEQTLLEAYLHAGGAEPAELDWFVASCFYKTASTIAVIAKQSRSRSRPDPRVEHAAATIPEILARGLKRTSTAGRPR